MKDISTPDFSTPSFNPRLFKKLKSPGLKGLGLKSLGLKCHSTYILMSITVNGILFFITVQYCGQCQ